MNPVDVLDDVDHMSEISEAWISNINNEIPEICQGICSEESFSEIGKNILKYTKGIAG